MMDDYNQSQNPQADNKFIKPKTRIPQQNASRRSSYVEGLAPIKNRLSLKSFLAAPVPPRKAKTSIYGSVRAVHYDSNSYIFSLNRIRNNIANKRKQKEEMRRMREHQERQRYLQKKHFMEEKGSFRDHFSSLNETPYQSYTKPQEVVLENAVTSKPKPEPVTEIKLPKEDNSRYFEEAELKSTAVSCQEKNSSKDMRSKNSYDIQYNDYNVDHDISPGIHQSHQKPEKEEADNSKSLLDELFEKSNQEDYNFASLFSN